MEELPEARYRIVCVLAGVLLTFRLLALLMVLWVYSTIFQFIRNTSGFPDTLTGAISIALAGIIVFLMPVVIYDFILRRTTRGLLIVATVLSCWMVGAYFLSQPKAGQYFNVMTGESWYKWGKTPTSKIELFPLGYNYHPHYGTKLEKVNPDIIVEYEKQLGLETDLKNKLADQQLEIKNFERERESTAARTKDQNAAIEAWKNRAENEKRETENLKKKYNSLEETLKSRDVDAEGKEKKSPAYSVEKLPPVVTDAAAVQQISSPSNDSFASKQKGRKIRDIVISVDNVKISKDYVIVSLNFFNDSDEEYGIAISWRAAKPSLTDDKGNNLPYDHGLPISYGSSVIDGGLRLYPKTNEAVLFFKGYDARAKAVGSNFDLSFGFLLVSKQASWPPTNHQVSFTGIRPH